MTPEEALEWAAHSNWTGGVERAVIDTLAAEVRACHATVKRLVVEREELDAELAKWRGKR